MPPSVLSPTPPPHSGVESACGNSMTHCFVSLLHSYSIRSPMGSGQRFFLPTDPAMYIIEERE